jgi:hypothetical protein
LASVDFSTIDSAFNDPKDAGCVRLIIKTIGGLITNIEKVHVGLKIIAEAVLEEIRIITKGAGTSDNKENSIHRQTNILRGFIKNTRKR